MFSSGEYSDYCVGGLYESDINLKDEEAVESLKLEFHKSLGFNEVVNCDIYARHKELVTGMASPNYTHNIDYTSYSRDSKLINEKYKELGGNEVDLCFESWLERTGVIKRVNYEELHELS